MSNIKRAPLEEIRAMRERGELYSDHPDAPEYDMPDGFWENVEVCKPLTKTSVTMRVDPDILDFFKQNGKGHLTRMHQVLRAYVDAKRKEAG